MNMETRFCIEYVNPRHPLRDNGSINVRYDRVLTLEQAEHDLTLILSFGAKILNLYIGNAADGKTGEWSPIPMIVDKDDWFTTDWLESLKDRYTCKPNLLSDIISGCNKGEFSQFEYSLIHFAMACSDENMTPKGIHCYAQTSLNEAKKEIKLTEEDEKTVHLACEFIRHHSNHTDSIGGIDCSTLIERLKSLRTWKPSDEQLKSLQEVIRNPYLSTAEYNGLIALKEQLKEL